MTVTVRDVVAVHPLILVTVTLYVVVDAGEIVTLVVIAPVLHEYEVPPLAVSVTLAPLQIGAGELIEAVGVGFTVTVRDVVAVQPLTSVTVTL